MKLTVTLIIFYHVTLLLAQDSEGQGDGYFVEIGSGEGEFDPAAVVYDIMNKKFARLEQRLQDLETEESKECGKLYTISQVDVIVNSLRNELIAAVNERLDNATEVLESKLSDNLKEELAKFEIKPKDTVADGGAASTPSPTTTTESNNYNSCQDVAVSGYGAGVYKLKINDKIIESYCDIHEITGDSSLVIQRRGKGDTDFYRSWKEYKNGFGDLQGDFWFGNDLIHEITISGDYKLRIELEDQHGRTAYAEYNQFRISDEPTGYTMFYSNYSGGSAGDSLRQSRGMRFTTFDHDQDGSILFNCAKLHKGAFWYDRCGGANLNGLLSEDSQTFHWQNIVWHSWYKDTRPLRKTAMKLMPI